MLISAFPCSLYLCYLNKCDVTHIEWLIIDCLHFMFDRLCDSKCCIQGANSIVHFVWQWTFQFLFNLEHQIVKDDMIYEN